MAAVSRLDLDEIRRQSVITLYARLRSNGAPEFCIPSRRERNGLQPKLGSANKVIYPDKEAAENAARDLMALGSRPLVAYPCPRSRRGHFHVATEKRPGKPVTR